MGPANPDRHLQKTLQSLLSCYSSEWSFSSNRDFSKAIDFIVANDKIYSSVEGYQYKISNWVERLIGNEIIKKDIFIYKADCNSSNQSHNSMWVK